MKQRSESHRQVFTSPRLVTTCDQTISHREVEMEALTGVTGGGGTSVFLPLLCIWSEKEVCFCGLLTGDDWVSAHFKSH